MSGSGTVLVRFWASARSAAGTPECEVVVPGEMDLAELESRVVAQLAAGEPSSLRRVLGVCSVLVGDRPAGGAERSTTRVTAGDVVEFLPPFAGG